MRRRACATHFARRPGTPAPLVWSVRQRVGFREVDAMAIVWHGRYAEYFEAAATELRRRCGLSYEDFLAARLRAPIVQLHVEYCSPLRLDEEIAICAALVWNEAARLDIEYAVKNGRGELAATGYTVQLFTDAATGQVCLVSPPLLERCRDRWRRGEFRHLQ
jgi:acyl-CoA thioester hydrolase